MEREREREREVDFACIVRGTSSFIFIVVLPPANIKYSVNSKNHEPIK